MPSQVVTTGLNGQHQRVKFKGSDLPTVSYPRPQAEAEHSSLRRTLCCRDLEQDRGEAASTQGWCGGKVTEASWGHVPSAPGHLGAGEAWSSP